MVALTKKLKLMALTRWRGNALATRQRRVNDKTGRWRVLNGLPRWRAHRYT